MYRLTGMILFCIAGIIACTKGYQPSNINILTQDNFIQVYFNHRQSNTVYAEPYRDLKRQGDNLESIIIQEITAAKSTIDLAVQELNLPLVAHALVERHRSGVMVRVILDNQYSRSQSKLTRQEIRQLNQREQQKYQNYLEYFADSIEQGFTAYPDMKEGIGTVALLQAMDKTLQTGIPVKIADVLAAYDIQL